MVTSSKKSKKVISYASLSLCAALFKTLESVNSKMVARKVFIPRWWGGMSTFEQSSLRSGMQKVAYFAKTKKKASTEVKSRWLIVSTNHVGHKEN